MRGLFRTVASDYGPEARRLLEEEAAALYEAAVDEGFLTLNDPRAQPGAASYPAFELLRDLGLLAPDADNRVLLPVDPATVQNRVVVPLGQRGSDLLKESAAWADTFGHLGQVFRRSPVTKMGPAITEIRGFEQINRFITSALADCQHELLTAQPRGGRSRQILATAAERDIRTLERGVKMRTLYQHPARRSIATREYVARVTAAGAEVRTLDEFFNRLIVIDRELAIIPVTSASDHAAVAIHHRSLVDYLVDIFDRFWERARPFTQRDAETSQGIADDVRAMTLRMLIEGHSDPASAKRVGVSPRTYAGYVAALKEEYKAQTRFQLGYQLGRGASGRLDEAYDDTELEE